MSESFAVVVPARYGSERFPAKVLADLGGLPLVAHTARAAEASGAATVIVATDDARVVDALTPLGLRCELTSVDHTSGTDRVHEVARRLAWTDDQIVVNLQGDEPLMPPAVIRACVDALAADRAADIATPVHAITDDRDYRSPHVVKVVMDASGRARCFSRAPIPADRAALLRGEATLPPCGAWRHIGLYAYRCSSLGRLAQLPVAPTEQAESLEQLRALWNGMQIQAVPVDQPPPTGVDTPEDLRRIQALFES
ncbi:3-deoxy-manno-octulosonate cytidylyltransferase [uncultured Abyssibacter sp.]|uniref:3-deoxy-manno-octulosonate cytidylyltransferase n=1 Tax=uncultured Abyssibacter sp. TaxID=2320202 RepID=UPI0032B23C0D